MSHEVLQSPSSLLEALLPEVPHLEKLRDYEDWWEREGDAASRGVDAAGTPVLRMFDALGRRVDEIIMPSDYGEMLGRGYLEGAVWRSAEENSLVPSYCIGYVTSFYDPGLYCPYTVSLATLLPLIKYGGEELKQRFLPGMLRKDNSVLQGATWMTEAGGGSDLGRTVETVARAKDGHWLLTGDKHFASNVGADVALVAARPEGAPKGVRGLALFLVPRLSPDGKLNYLVRRLKDKCGTRSVPTGEVELRSSVGYLLGDANRGIYLILEVLNISRVANSVASVALAQRAMADALAFAGERHAFGKPILEHPLMKAQFDERFDDLLLGFALAWEAVRLLDGVWRETPPYSDRHSLFRLVAHLAKYWTAENAVRTARWAMEVHGGAGVLAEYQVDRWLREAMVLSIWEGTSHRQILDGLEAMEKKKAHRLLLDRLERDADSEEVEAMRSWIEDHLSLDPDERQAKAGQLFHELAVFTAGAILRRTRDGSGATEAKDGNDCGEASE